MNKRVIIISVVIVCVVVLVLGLALGLGLRKSDKKKTRGNKKGPIGSGIDDLLVCENGLQQFKTANAQCGGKASDIAVKCGAFANRYCIQSCKSGDRRKCKSAGCFDGNLCCNYECKRKKEGTVVPATLLICKKNLTTWPEAGLRNCPLHVPIQTDCVVTKNGSCFVTCEKNREKNRIDFSTCGKPDCSSTLPVCCQFTCSNSSSVIKDPDDLLVCENGLQQFKTANAQCDGKASNIAVKCGAFANRYCIQSCESGGRRKCKSAGCFDGNVCCNYECKTKKESTVVPADLPMCKKNLPAWPDAGLKNCPSNVPIIADCAVEKNGSCSVTCQRNREKDRIDFSTCGKPDCSNTLPICCQYTCANSSSVGNHTIGRKSDLLVCETGLQQFNTAMVQCQGKFTNIDVNCVFSKRACIKTCDKDDTRKCLSAGCFDSPICCNYKCKTT